MAMGRGTKQPLPSRTSLSHNYHGLHAFPAHGPHVHFDAWLCCPFAPAAAPAVAAPPRRARGATGRRAAAGDDGAGALRRGAAAGGGDVSDLCGDHHGGEMGHGPWDAMGMDFE